MNNSKTTLETNEQILKNHFPQITDIQLQKLLQLEALYTDWNAKINVVSRKDMDMFFVHHVLHSLAILKFENIPAGSFIIDIGTGGGFPAIPLAIMLPECRFVACDSIGKKIKVVSEIVKALKLENVRPYNGRAELMTERFDYIVSRAVTALPAFVEMFFPLFKRNGTGKILYLKGGDFNEELAEISLENEVFEISKVYEHPFFETKKLVKLYQ